MKDNKLVLIFVGILSGLLCGLLGVGGGVIVVLYFTLILKQEQHIAQATAISVIVAASTVSCIVYWYSGALDWKLIGGSILGSIAGGYVGARLMKKISAANLRRIFGFFMLIAGVYMFI